MKLSELITLEGDREFYEIVWDKPPEAVIETTTVATTKKIDMSRCIESGIDCEFSDNAGHHSIAFLLSTDNGEFNHQSSYGKYWKNCRPRMNHIHACPDGFHEYPLPEGFVIKIYFQNSGVVITSYYKNYNWECVNDAERIIAFEVTDIADGYEL